MPYVGSPVQSLQEGVVRLGPIAMDERLRIGADYDSDEPDAAHAPADGTALPDQATPAPPAAKRAYKRRAPGDAKPKRKNVKSSERTKQQPGKEKRSHKRRESPEGGALLHFAL